MGCVKLGEKIAFTCLQWVNKPQINYPISRNPWEVIISGPVVLKMWKIIGTATKNDRSCTCVAVDCSLVDPPPPPPAVASGVAAVAVEWSSQKSDEDSSERGRECRDRWPVGLQEIQHQL